MASFTGTRGSYRGDCGPRLQLDPSNNPLFRAGPKGLPGDQATFLVSMKTGGELIRTDSGSLPGRAPGAAVGWGGSQVTCGSAPAFSPFITEEKREGGCNMLWLGEFSEVIFPVTQFTGGGHGPSCRISLCIMCTCVFGPNFQEKNLSF